jgi:hypothetical protein
LAAERGVDAQRGRVDAYLTLTMRSDGSCVFDSLEPPYEDTKFLPIDNAGFGIEVGTTDISGVERKFQFTSELKYWFTYTRRRPRRWSSAASGDSSTTASRWTSAACTAHWPMDCRRRRLRLFERAIATRDDATVTEQVSPTVTFVAPWSPHRLDW